MKKLFYVSLFILACMFLLNGVLLAQSSDNTVSITGRVQHFSFENGFYGIVGDDDTEYKPLNLSSSYHVEGLPVKLRAKLVKKKLLTHGWGVPIEILSIKRNINKN